MSYKSLNSLSFEEAEGNPLVVVDLKTLQQIITNIFKKLIGCPNQNTGLLPPNPKNDDEEIMTIDEVLKLLKVSKVTIHNWKRKGLIKGHKIGRKLYFKKREIDMALRQQKYSIN